MALIKYGALATNISGTIGGQVFGSGRSGYYIKNIGTKTKQTTKLQGKRVSILAAASQMWRNLSQNERDFWNNASPFYPYVNRLGETKYYSGYNIFVQNKINQFTVGITSANLPTPKQTFLPVTNLRLDKPGSQNVIRDDGNDSFNYYLLFCSKPSSAGISSAYRNMYLMEIVNSQGSSHTWFIQSLLQNRFGGWAPGQKIWFYIKAIDSRTSQGQIMTPVVSGILQ